MKFYKAFLAIISLLVVINVNAQDNAQNDNRLANNLIKLRGQVEDLQAELKILKSENKNSLVYLSTRKTELQSNVDRKKLQLQQTQIQYDELLEKVKSLGADSEQLIPDVENLISSIKQTLNKGIPFKQKERLSVVQDIQRKLNARKITSQNAINRLWAFLEDELRLTRENAIYSQTIELNGENVLVEIAKLGTVMMYFKTREERFGKAEINDQGQWHYRLFTLPREIKQASVLFDSLKKQIRQGYFTLPLSAKL